MKQELKIPKQILQLVELGIWPGKEAERINPDHKPVISAERLKEFAPEEFDLHLYKLPFKRIRDELTPQDMYWNTYGALHQIDPDLTLIIGDFGFGSDTCLILNYRENLEEPVVYRLVFVGENENYWKKVADNFTTFCYMTGLSNYIQ